MKFLTHEGPSNGSSIYSVKIICSVVELRWFNVQGFIKIYFAENSLW